ncbi:NAD-dependent dehydratase [Gallaecimonas sp. GXIMD4217]|uniref:NAD-dependent dehydratase n=1 Tax=Gallaecimonas sp. GXIMD4217 TaxID=3131927 RepID=UPI00311ACA17
MTLLLLGATGAVGRQLLALALADARVDKVVVLSRTPLPSHPKLHNPVLDFSQLPDDATWWRADAALCCLGTTLKAAGGKSAFRAVDHDLVLALARLAREHGTPAWAYCSSMGANARAANFYLRVKGETERDLQLLDFPCLCLVRPSLLDAGPRAQRRLGEELALTLCRLLGPLLPRRWRPIKTKLVARAMLEWALRPKKGIKVLCSETLQLR